MRWFFVFLALLCLPAYGVFSFLKSKQPAYDTKFLWNDDQLYCSELVWKLYRSAGDVELAKPRRFDSFNTELPVVRALIIERFGSFENFPAGEQVVAPSDLATSPLLIEALRRASKK